MAIAVMALFVIWFRAPGATPSGGFMVFSLGYGFVFASIGGYATAAIAKRREMAHALSLAGFSLLMGIVSMIMAAGGEPLWYQLANMAVHGVRRGAGRPPEGQASHESEVAGNPWR